MPPNHSAVAAPPLDQALRGIGLVAAGYATVAVSDAMVKWVLPEIGTAAAMVWRGLFGALTIALLVRGRIPRAVNRRLLLARCTVHCGVTVLFYLVWQRGMPLADSYAIAAVAPLLMTLLAIPVLGESVGWRRWASTGFGFCGVLVMLRPGGALWGLDAALLLVAVGMMALTRIWTRLLARTDKPAAITFWLMLAHVPAGLLLMPALPPPQWLPGPGTLLLLMLLGASNGIAHWLFARAFALAPVSLLAPFEYSTLVWGTLLGLLVWGNFPAGGTLAGAAIVIAAGLYNLHRERLRRREARKELAG
ncbi:DMT family transporter [Teichococcus vastitatis]|uniref:DMT family transporter n=1 Tax=Teichococcus vastitatis TaxID=2307076 RepID=A0ABS9W012_9PROT|nr:DMT family transporter [Pseudoroseomonas vastitatis]MCI0752501.1 DMT family transporter [Pseudoroseomonas vastitatis]